MYPEEMLRKLINNHYRRLQKLKEKEALYGLSVDPGIPLEIEDIEERITKLEQELEETGGEVSLSRQTRAMVSDSGQRNGQDSSVSMMSVFQLALPDQNRALRDLRRWLMSR